MHESVVPSTVWTFSQRLVERFHAMVATLQIFFHVFPFKDECLLQELNDFSGCMLVNVNVVSVTFQRHFIPVVDETGATVKSHRRNCRIIYRVHLELFPEMAVVNKCVKEN